MRGTRLNTERASERRQRKKTGAKAKILAVTARTPASAAPLSPTLCCRCFPSLLLLPHLLLTQHPSSSPHPLQDGGGWIRCACVWPEPRTTVGKKQKPQCNVVRPIWSIVKIQARTASICYLPLYLPSLSSLHPCLCTIRGRNGRRSGSGISLRLERQWEGVVLAIFFLTICLISMCT